MCSLTAFAASRSSHPEPRTVRRVATFVSRCAISLPLLFALFASHAPAAAQDLDDVSISGVVVDQNGGALPGASVTATHVATKAARSVVTDDEGRFRFVELPPGAYTVRVACAGFAVEERTGLELLAGRGARLDFALRVAGVSRRADGRERGGSAAR